MTPPSVTLLRTQSDERLVTLARAGHERAFEAIVERYRRPLLRHSRRYLPEARAEDALQQALVSAWTALQRGDDVRELRPWLHRIVHNTSLNARRAAGYDYEQLHDTLHGTGGPAELVERSAVVRSTLAGLAALPERQRDALLQIAVEGRSQDEVAHELGLSQGAVRQLVHRARTSLRAAATAVTPLPLAGWLATGGERADVAARVGELVAAGGGSATLAKAGAVAVLAGGAVTGPAIVQHVDRPRAATAQSAAAATPARAASSDAGTADQGTGDAAATPIATARVRTGGRHGKGSGSGSGRGGGEDHSGSVRHRGGDDSGSGRSGSGDDSGSSGSGRGTDDGDHSGSSGSGDDGDHSGSGSGSHDGGDDAESGSGGERSGSVSDEQRSATSGSGSGGGGDDPPQLPSAGDDGSASSGSSGGGGSDDSGSSHGGSDGPAKSDD